MQIPPLSKIVHLHFRKKWLMLLREILPVYSESHMTLTNTLSGRNGYLLADSRGKLHKYANCIHYVRVCPRISPRITALELLNVGAVCSHLLMLVPCSRIFLP
jgi:hypothetical protein